jgi:nucleotide-binding universal stress UspA family protein
MGPRTHFGGGGRQALWPHGERPERVMAGGTVVCGVDETPEAHEAAGMAAALATRLGLRLVLAHVVADGRVDHVSAALAQLVVRLPGSDEVEVRVETGDRADLLGQIAAEEGADLIVLGSRPRRLRARWLRCRLARELETITPVPIVIAPPQTRRRSARRLAVATAPAASQ